MGVYQLCSPKVLLQQNFYGKGEGRSANISMYVQELEEVTKIWDVSYIIM